MGQALIDWSQPEAGPLSPTATARLLPRAWPHHFQLVLLNGLGCNEAGACQPRESMYMGGAIGGLGIHCHQSLH